MSHEPSVCHERAAIVTECYEKFRGELPPVLLRAKCLAARSWHTDGSWDMTHCRNRAVRNSS
jgi:hypothetical protein